MSNFVILPSPDYTSELIRLVPEFASSDELKLLDRELRTMPVLSFAAFGLFFENQPPQSAISLACAQALEELSSRQDPDIEDLLVTGTFEAFQSPHETAVRLHPRSREIFDRWMT